MSRSGIICSLSLWLLSSNGAAEPIVEKHDRTELNWTTMTVRYYGEATPPSNAGALDFKKAELAARTEGGQYFARALGELRGQSPSGSPITSAPPDGKVESAPPADGQGSTDEATPKSRSLTTVYFPSGRVRIEMEAPLGEVIKPAGLRFAEQQMAKIQADKTSGIVIQANKSVPPATTFTVLDEGQNVLYDASKVSQEAFAKSTMARWVKRPSKAELAAIAGNHYKIVEGRWTSENTLVVARQKWDEALADGPLPLINGAVALALP